MCILVVQYRTVRGENHLSLPQFVDHMHIFKVHLIAVAIYSISKSGLCTLLNPAWCVVNGLVLIYIVPFYSVKHLKCFLTASLTHAALLFMP